MNTVEELFEVLEENKKHMKKMLGKANNLINRVETMTKTLDTVMEIQEKTTKLQEQLKRRIDAIEYMMMSDNDVEVFGDDTPVRPELN